MTQLERPPADYVAARLRQDDDNPEWTEADFARARPFKEGFPAAVKASGRGYNARVDQVLRDALAEGKL